MSVMKKLSPAFWASVCAVAVPVFYLVAYTPYGMDTTDFGYFYAYAWRIMQGEVPYRDFFYIKPALPLYWHALWMSLTPFRWQILAGKAGFCLSMLASSWLGSLYLAQTFDLRALGIRLPLLATAAFVFGIHCFPHMPWHTADGVLFCAGALLAASSGYMALGGFCAAAAILCKQSFLLVPLVMLLYLWASGRRWVPFLVALAFGIAAWVCWLMVNGAWDAFMTQTTGQLDIREAVDAGILIYLRQNWALPLLACVPLLIATGLGMRLPSLLAPAWCYLAALTVTMFFLVTEQKNWIGFGLSWPTLFVVLGGVAILLPKFFLRPYARRVNGHCGNITLSLSLAAALICSWSVAISGGYKIPAFFAAPLLFSFFLFHARFFGSARALCWGALACGLVIFAVAWQYPYTFPARPLTKSELKYDAGAVYAQASGVKVDADMLARLEELKELRATYGPNYKTLPGFSFAYYLNGDRPVIASDWLIDWEINGQVDVLYDELTRKNVTVFMERDQLDAAKADAYDRAAYGVPQRVRKHWRVVAETPHFVVFQSPEAMPRDHQLPGIEK